MQTKRKLSTYQLFQEKNKFKKAQINQDHTSNKQKNLMLPLPCYSELHDFLILKKLEYQLRLGPVCSNFEMGVRAKQFVPEKFFEVLSQFSMIFFQQFDCSAEGYFLAFKRNCLTYC